ncbi:structural maintenance of chromosomes family protein [Tanacetum coccineum]
MEKATHSDHVVTHTYIDRVIIEGFKSYGVKSIFQGLHPTLTCIAGPGKSDFLDSVFFALGFNPSDLRGAELFFGTSKTSVSIVLKTPYLPKDTTRITREISLNQGETCSSYQMDGNTSTEDAVKAFLKSVHLRARPPITKEKLEAGMPCDFYDLLAEASSVPIGVRDERDHLVRQIDLQNDLLLDLDNAFGKLGSAKRDFEVWSANKLELAKLQKTSICFEYQQALKERSEAAHQLNDIGQRIRQIVSDRQRFEAESQRASDIKTVSGRIADLTASIRRDIENQPEIVELSKKLSGLINVGNASKSGALKEMQDHENDKEMLCIRSSELSDREKKLRKLANEVSQLETRVAKLKVELDKQNDLLVKLKPETEFTERKQRVESRNFTKELEALRRHENESRTTHESYSKRIDEMCMEHSWIVTEEELNISADDYHKAKEDYGELLTKQHENRSLPLQFFWIEPRLVKDVDNRLAELHQQRNELVNVIIPGLTGDLTKIDSNEGEKLKTNCDAVNLYLRQCLALLPGLSARQSVLPSSSCCNLAECPGRRRAKHCRRYKFTASQFVLSFSPSFESIFVRSPNIFSFFHSLGLYLFPSLTGFRVKYIFGPGGLDKWDDCNDKDDCL